MFVEEVVIYDNLFFLRCTRHGVFLGSESIGPVPTTGSTTSSSSNQETNLLHFAIHNMGLMNICYTKYFGGFTYR
ncbi:hypothetical protein D6B99_11190 [Arachidicoccus soli]|uniref:Uncharacterized protein n=1 Tax=Arachidicoccus soli TaxID=2341117 RepID=A0A386HQ86_9BACT|nr:hypothetical protein D6B99_11190 [Arachidicoccus soli]